MADVSAATPGTVAEGRPSRVRSMIAATEIDTRLLGMVIALVILWVGFNIISGGTFLTARNLWNLSVQSAAIAIMATGMVLIIVSRNIDLSVGAVLGFVGYTMAMLQTDWIPNVLGLGFDQPYTWIVTVLVGVGIGAVIGAISGFVIAYLGVPSFIVTLGGLLVWRGLIFRYAQGQTIAPLDTNFRLLGGGPEGSMGDLASWVLGILICVAIAYSLFAARRRRRRYDFPVRPMWAEVTLALIGFAVVLVAVWIANSYPWPDALAQQRAADQGIEVPPGGFATGIAFPVLITLIVGVAMTWLATRRRFGRYVYAIGGNPEAAELSGINVRRTIMLTFVLMGILCAISAAVVTARLNSAVIGLGIQNELDVISAAVIGGTSFAGGIGTIPGAILGAVVMQSLRSGMLLINVDSPTQDVIIGIVLVVAVGFDAWMRRRGT